MQNQDDKEFAESIEVVSGSPTPDEMAAVIAVLTEARKQQDMAKLPHRSTWAKNSSILRNGIVAGNGQWGSQYKDGL